MAKVLGVGGVFFKSPDPAGLRTWYARWLGLYTEEHGVMFHPDTMPAGAFTLWSPFPVATEYFEPSQDAFMINFVVDDLDAMLAKARAGGARVMDKIEEYDYGRFGWFLDPDGHKVELWQPPAA